MLESSGFDLWSGDYDKSIPRLSEGYPFEGYYQILEFINRKIELTKDSKILDIGVGTGLLSKELAQRGADIYGIDFSLGMLEKAQKAIPNGHFFHHDFNSGIPEELLSIQFDYIISSYAIHHLSNDKKVEFILILKKILKPNGKILIGDIAFQTMQELEQCKKYSSEHWDEEEIYMVAESMVETLKLAGLKSIYTQVSTCAGILEVG